MYPLAAMSSAVDIIQEARTKKYRDDEQQDEDKVKWPYLYAGLKVDKEVGKVSLVFNCRGAY